MLAVLHVNNHVELPHVLTALSFQYFTFKVNCVLRGIVIEYFPMESPTCPVKTGVPNGSLETTPLPSTSYAVTVALLKPQAMALSDVTVLGK